MIIGRWCRAGAETLRLGARAGGSLSSSRAAPNERTGTCAARGSRHVPQAGPRSSSSIASQTGFPGQTGPRGSLRGSCADDR
eukprot:6762726-Pyramimonas_sp.AAC.1